MLYHSVRKINFQEEALVVRYKGDQVLLLWYMSGLYIDYLSGREIGRNCKTLLGMYRRPESISRIFRS